MTRLDVLERFVRKVRVNDETGCWLWAGAVSASGYGNFTVDGKQNGAHRAAWELFRGPIPEGDELDHFVCAEKRCVNPAHLEPVPVKGRVNTKRYQASKTHCARGHERTPENRRTDAGTNKSRCRICDVENQRRRRRAAGRPRIPGREIDLCGGVLVEDDAAQVPA